MSQEVLKRLRPLSFAELQARVAAAERHAGATITPSDAECRARASIDTRRAAAMTGAEWREARGNLLSFIAILAEWSERADERA